MCRVGWLSRSTRRSIVLQNAANWSLSGRNEVQSKVGASASHAHFVMLVVPRVVHDEMELNFAGRHFIQFAQKVENLLMPIAVVALANHLPLYGLQASE
jgi:hypothetical protein